MIAVTPFTTRQERMVSEAIRSAAEIAPVRWYRIYINKKSGDKEAPCAKGMEYAQLSESDEIAAAAEVAIYGKPATGHGICCDDLIVLDADGPEGMRQLVVMKDKLPETRRHRSQSGGEHVIYRNASGCTFNSNTKKEIFEGIDIKCSGVIFGPGSWVEDGGEYKALNDLPVADAPEWLIKELIKGGLEKHERPQRTGNIFSVAAPLIDSALESLDPDCDYGTWIEIGMALHSAGHGDKWTEWSSEGSKFKPGECEKHLERFDTGGGITLATLFHHAREAGWVADVQIPYWQNDLGNAERLALLVADQVRHNTDLGEDWVWTDQGWKIDRGNTLHKAFDKVIDGLYAEARALPKGVEANAAFRHAKSSGNSTRVKAAIEFARMESPIATRLDDWDSDGELITFADGTVLNVRTMESRPMGRGDLIRRRINAPFDKEAKCPEFEYLINHLVDGDEKARAWLLQLWSTGLAGSILPGIILVVWGASKSGKTTTVEILKRVLGEYACSPAPEFIIKSKYPNAANAPNAEIVNLQGRRAAFIAEFPPGRLDENKIKTLTGGDTLSVRKLYSNTFIDVRCRLTLTISSNSKPFFDATDAGMLRRVRALNVRNPIDFAKKAERLNAIDWIFQKEAAGIAALLVRSLRDLIAAGEVLPESERIAEDTGQLNLANDRVGQWLQKRCETAEECEQSKVDLARSYERFCEEEGHTAFSRRRFYEVMETVHGFREKKVKGERRYAGVQEAL